MKQKFAQSPLVLIVFLLSVTNSGAQVSKDNQLGKVIIIRHAEKPDEGDNLSCQGLNRALALADVLYNKFKLPDYIFVPSVKTGKKTGVARMYQTIVPFAVKHNLTIDTQFNVEDATALAESVLKKSGTILIVWEHKSIPEIAEKLGVKDKNLKWKGDDFDSIWIITFRNGEAVLSLDNENLHPVAGCK